MLRAQAGFAAGVPRHHADGGAVVHLLTLRKGCQRTRSRSSGGVRGVGLLPGVPGRARRGVGVGLGGVGVDCR